MARYEMTWIRVNLTDITADRGVGVQVLTHNLATRLGLTDVDRQLDERFSTISHIEFDDYARFLANALFGRRLVDGSTASASAPLDGVDEVCWFVCAKTYCVSQERLLK